MERGEGKESGKDEKGMGKEEKGMGERERGGKGTYKI